jgi:hypothetical protein
VYLLKHILNNIILQKIIRKLTIKKGSVCRILRKKSNGKHHQTNAPQPSQKIINTPQAV